MSRHLHPFVPSEVYERQLDPLKHEIRLLRYIDITNSDRDVTGPTDESYDEPPSSTDGSSRSEDDDLSKSLDFVMDYVSLNDNPKYIAYSYEWGSGSWAYEESGLSTSVNGNAVHLTENLVQALQYSKGGHKFYRIWVDALCIYVSQQQVSCHRFWRHLPLFLEVFIGGFPSDTG
jgi:hypothetical protein